MDGAGAPERRAGDEGRLLSTLQHLLEIEATEVKAAVERASHLLSQTLDIDKVDTFLYDPRTESLVALGVSSTPMGSRQRAIGLDRMPIANGGRTVEVYENGETYISGRVHEDMRVLEGVRNGLGVRSMMLVPLQVQGVRRGVLAASDATEERFSEEDLHFLEAVARWVGLIIHRAELVETIAQDAAERGRRAAAFELITILAHDLGNYVTPLKGRLDLIRRRASREARQQDVDHIDAASRSFNRVQRLIGDLLDASRLERGLFSLSTAPVDCVSLVRETAELLATDEIRIDTQVPEELTIEADAGRVRQALENLISNAVEHSPPGVPILVEVREERRDDGAWAVIAVRDGGPGIEPEAIPSLFDRFMRGHASKGLDLGLYLARGIAEAHGGTISVQSVPGQGATFALSLPA